MASAYDAASHRIILFGGFDGAHYLADTWAFDGKDWTQLSPQTSPPVRVAAGMAYDVPSHKLVLFGGYNGTAWLGDTWIYDSATNAWQQANPKHPPRQGTGPSVFTEARSGHVIVYGGFDGSQKIGYSNHTLLWTGTDWRKMTSTPPSARSSAGAARDPRTQEVVLFDGLGSVNPYSTWVWKSHVWTQQSPTQMPPPRFSMGLACDTDLAGCILFGGDQGGLSLGDSWLWDGKAAQWQQFTAAGSPGAREAFAMQYFPPAREIIVFGGLQATAKKQQMLNDTWTLQ